MENATLFQGTNNFKILGNKTNFYLLIKDKRRVESLILPSLIYGLNRFIELETKRSQNEPKLFQSQVRQKIEETISDLIWEQKWLKKTM